MDEGRGVHVNVLRALLNQLLHGVSSGRLTAFLLLFFLFLRGLLGTGSGSSGLLLLRVLIRGRLAGTRSGTAIWDLDKLTATIDSLDLVENVVAVALKLNLVTLLELSDVRISQRGRLETRLWREEVGKVVVFLELLLRNQIVKVKEHDRSEMTRLGRLSEPSDLFLGHLKVSVEMSLELKSRHDAILHALVAHNDIAPVHERNFLIVAKASRIRLLQENMTVIHGGLHTQLSILLVARHLLLMRRWGTLNGRLDELVL